MEGNEKRREEIFSVSVRAGKRTYFFDVKETKQGDFYLTITESKKVFDRDGNSRFEKHKVFLYKEDFGKFAEGYEQAVQYIKEQKPEYFIPRETDDMDQNDSIDTDSVDNSEE